MTVAKPKFGVMPASFFSCGGPLHEIRPAESSSIEDDAGGDLRYPFRSSRRRPSRCALRVLEKQSPVVRQPRSPVRVTAMEAATARPFDRAGGGSGSQPGGRHLELRAIQTSDGTVDQSRALNPGVPPTTLLGIADPCAVGQPDAGQKSFGIGRGYWLNRRRGPSRSGFGHFRTRLSPTGLKGVYIDAGS